jgi:tRNA A-37 threonylcarbamoyl transferase component Bud32
MPSGDPLGGRYELVEEISSGGMGKVWRGYDKVLDREVAVKQIRPEVVSAAADAEQLTKRFQREARITARIGHHGVPQVYDAFLSQSHLGVYLVMELVRGIPLTAFVDSSRLLPIPWAAAIGAQIATVLSHAHAVPVVHRDLKPANILVTQDGMVKVLDFGIARVLGTDVTRLTSTGTPIGTSAYMSPEQVHGLSTITPSSDLYALGCILHELLCGLQVFSGASDFELFQQHDHAEPAPLRTLRPDVPAPLELLVLDLLAKLPEQRPADAYEVYERLLPFLPMPGSPAPDGTGLSEGMPDPTLLYRRPNAPRLRVRTTEALDASDSAGSGPAKVADGAIVEAIKLASDQAQGLIEEERFAQAADLLGETFSVAAPVLGSENPRVLRLRLHRAAVLILGNEPRRALPEFEAMAAIYARTEGPLSGKALQCRRQAADCRAALGQFTLALEQFRSVLDAVRATEGDSSDTAIDLRRNVGILLMADGRREQAAATRRSVYPPRPGRRGKPGGCRTLGPTCFDVTYPPWVPICPRLRKVAVITPVTPTALLLRKRWMRLHPARPMTGGPTRWSSRRGSRSWLSAGLGPRASADRRWPGVR